MSEKKDQYIMIFTLRPVQSFIQEARKFMDLKNGSQFLSRIIQNALETLVNEKEKMIDAKVSTIFPYYQTPSEMVQNYEKTNQLKSLPAYPNLFTVKITLNDSSRAYEELKKLPLKLKEKIMDYIMKDIEQVLLKTDTFKALKDESKQTLVEYTKTQVEDLLVFDWVIAPLNRENQLQTFESLNSYFLTAKKMWELPLFLGTTPDRKDGSTSDNKFVDYDKVYGGNKCSVCGKRKALIVFKSPKEKPRTQLDKIPPYYVEISNPREATPKEKICGVCFVKRVWNVTDEGKFGHFVSLAQLANSHVVKALEEYNPSYEQTNNLTDDPIGKLYRKFEEFVEDLYELIKQPIYFQPLNKRHPPKEKLDKSEKYFLDFELFLPDELISEKIIIKRLLNKENTDYSKSVINKILKLKQEISGSSLRRYFSKYYALMLFDGDDMGEIIRGKSCGNKILNPNSSKKIYELQQKVSKALHGFTNEVYSIIEKSPIPHESVYIGGDDILCAFNISNVFDIINNIREVYPKTLGNCENPTASAGIIITHYKYPLREALLQLRKTEKKAKSVDGKDSLAITILTRSGNRIDSVVKWNYKISCDDANLFTDISYLLIPKEKQSVELIEYLNSHQNVNSLDLLKTFIVLFEKNILSPNFIYALNEEFKFEPFHSSNTASRSSLPDEIIQVFIIELYRLLKRSIKNEIKNIEKYEPLDLPSSYDLPPKILKPRKTTDNSQLHNKEENALSPTLWLLLKITFHTLILLKNTNNIKNILDFFEIAKFVASNKGRPLGKKHGKKIGEK